MTMATPMPSPMAAIGPGAPSPVGVLLLNYRHTWPIQRDGLRQPCRWRVIHETAATAGSAAPIAASANSVSLITHVWKKCVWWSYGVARRMR